MNELDRVFEQYVRTALWSSNDESDETGGEPMDDRYGPDDITEESLARMRADCERFVAQARPLIDQLDGVPASALGHDFWLTRNGHGAGFWDGDYPEGIGEALTKIAESFGECTLFVSDAGQIGII
jgi:hypothetical protein